MKAYLTNTRKDWRFKMMCGSGKTRLAIEMIKCTPDIKKTCILVPTVALLDQWYDTLVKEGIDIGRVCTNYKENNKNIICVYNSFPTISSIKFNRIIIDEAHHIKNKSKYKKTYIDKIIKF